MNFSPKHIQVWNPSLLSRTRWLYSNLHLPPPSRMFHKPLPGSRHFWELALPTVCFCTHSTDPTVSVHHPLGLGPPPPWLVPALFCNSPLFFNSLCHSPCGNSPLSTLEGQTQERSSALSGAQQASSLRSLGSGQASGSAIRCVPVYPTSTWACWSSCPQCLEGGSEDNQCSVKYLLKEKSWCAMLLTITTKIYT